MITYKELLDKLKKLNEKQLYNTVTIYEPVEQEFIGAFDAYEIENSDVLDPKHFVIELKA